MNENNNSNLNQEIQPVNTETPKQNKAGIILSIIFILCLAGIGFYFISIKTDLFNKEEKEEEEKESVTEEKKEEKIEYSGIYKDGKKIIKLYCQENNECYISMENGDGGGIETDIVIHNNRADEDEIELKFEKDTIIVTEYPEDEDDMYEIGGTYKKEKEYKVLDFYKDNYGDPELLNTKYNGYYELNDNKMYIFQIDEENARVYITGEKIGIFDIEFKIENEKLHETFFDNEYEIEIIADEAIFTTIKKDDDEEEKELDGTYKKLRNIDYKEIIKNITP